MRARRLATLAAFAVVFAWSSAAAHQGPRVEDAIGTWRSVEQFEGESRLSFGFKTAAGEMSGWGVMLGQKRKADHRATLAMTFYGVKWDKDRLRFESLLPEDGGTIGWELRLLDAKRSRLVAVTLNGDPLDDDDLAWDMIR
jgi:hypothetical protein